MTFGQIERDGGVAVQSDVPDVDRREGPRRTLRAFEIPGDHPHAAATAGVECRKDAEVIDETPAAYKSIDQVMNAQRDLVEVVYTLKQVVCVKG